MAGSYETTTTNPDASDFVLYETGFGEFDIFGRKSLGEALSNLITRVDDNLVIAIDGGWGAGKSYFLTRWSGAHGKENNGQHITVYFDAHESDYTLDPLPAIFAAINSRLKQLGYIKELEQFNRVALGTGEFLWKGIRGLGPGAVEFLAANLGFFTGGNASKATDAFFQASEETIKRRADFIAQSRNTVAALREELRNLLKKLPENRLVLVIDELDRCRPDFAIETIEAVKHLFCVPGLHVVFGINISAFESSIQSRYGEKIDTSRYIEKYIPITFTLPLESNGNLYALEYIRLSSKIKLKSTKTTSCINKYIEIINKKEAISLRHCELIIRRLSLAEQALDLENRPEIYSHVVVIGTIMRVLAPDIVDQLGRNEDWGASFRALWQAPSPRTKHPESIPFTMLQLFQSPIILNKRSYLEREVNIRQDLESCGLINIQKAEWPTSTRSLVAQMVDFYQI